MLYLIGLGLHDEKDLTLRGVEAAKKCGKIYLELYTCRNANPKELEKVLGKPVAELGRKEVEEAHGFITEAKEKDIALLVGGDPLVATTHVEILLRAKALGVLVKIIHNASILTAVAETGLQPYKFGKTTTAVFWEENYKPTSFYNVIAQNKKQGLHTLVLLDIKQAKCMTANQGIELLLKIEEQEKVGAFTSETNCFVLARAGGDTGIWFGKAGELVQKNFGDGMHVLVIPGQMHDLEARMAETYK